MPRIALKVYALELRSLLIHLGFILGAGRYYREHCRIQDLAGDSFLVAGRYVTGILIFILLSLDTMAGSCCSIVLDLAGVRRVD